MQIKAIQKLTLLDFPGKTAATVFTCGCNLRCPFCHNASLVIGAPKPEGEGPVNTPGEGSVNTPGEGLAGSSGGVFEDEPTVPESELFALLEKRRGLLDGVAITGGEPLLQPDLPDFIRKIREMGFMVKLDTNGFLPGRLEDLIREGLVDYVAVDFKQTPGKYGEADGIPQASAGQRRCPRIPHHDGEGDPRAFGHYRDCGDPGARGKLFPPDVRGFGRRAGKPHRRGRPLRIHAGRG